MINTLTKNTAQNTIQNKAGVGKYLLDKLNHSENEMTDEEKQKMDMKIQSKLKRGKKLTIEERRYLQETNPLMYQHAMRVQREAEMVEEQLKHAKSKEEVHTIVSCAINSVSKNDPDREYIIAAINELSDEIHKSPSYSRLPATEEEAKRRVGQRDNKVEWDDEDDDNDLMNWSPLQEVIDSSPSFTAGA